MSPIFKLICLGVKVLNSKLNVSYILSYHKIQTPNPHHLTPNLYPPFFFSTIRKVVPSLRTELLTNIFPL
ncbi:MAG: hypothetical protein FD155_2816 [Bacteroidetes bacterium]|nr:MAG: hypothetical protein FD155_2816 [Bacteroidota bacterium]